MFAECILTCILVKKKREEEKTKKETMDKGISNFFTKGPIVAQPKAKVPPFTYLLRIILLTAHVACQNQSR